MWIRTQDRKSLLEVERFTIQKNYGDATKKFSLCGSYKVYSFLETSLIILGYYSNIEEAQKELDNIGLALINKEKIYELN